MINDLLDKKVTRYATIFLYPFYYTHGKKREVIDTLEENGKWKARPFKVKENYHEYVYFHPYIRDILFHQEEKKKAGIWSILSLNLCDILFQQKEKDKFYNYPVTQLHYQCEKRLSLYVKYPDKIGNRDYKDFVPSKELSYPVDSIQISLFDFDIGILSIKIEESILLPDYSEKRFKEILCFNELARRIAPSFSIDAQKEAGLLLDAIGFKGIEDSMEKFMKISDSITDGVVEVSQTIQYLLNPLSNQKVFGQENKDKPGFQTALDERMIVYSYVCLDKDELRENEIVINDEAFLTFTLVDKGWQESFANSELVDTYIKLHAYDNWKEYGTRFGFSRYSGVCLVAESRKGVEKAKNENKIEALFSFHTLYTHFETVYYEIALIVYFHRAALLKFSKDAADCADSFFQSIHKVKKNAYKKTESLREEFLLFKNKYWFTEITNQEQGIDIFNKWKEVNKNKELFDEVSQELSELNEYIKREQEGKLNLLIGILTILASIGLILTVWIGFFGMNIHPMTGFRWDFFFWKWHISAGHILFFSSIIFTLIILFIDFIVFLDRFIGFRLWKWISSKIEGF